MKNLPKALIANKNTTIMIAKENNLHPLKWKYF